MKGKNIFLWYRFFFFSIFESQYHPLPLSFVLWKRAAQTFYLNKNILFPFYWKIFKLISLMEAIFNFWVNFAFKRIIKYPFGFVIIYFCRNAQYTSTILDDIGDMFIIISCYWIFNCVCSFPPSLHLNLPSSNAYLKLLSKNTNNLVTVKCNFLANLNININVSTYTL